MSRSRLLCLQVLVAVFTAPSGTLERDGGLRLAKQVASGRPALAVSPLGGLLLMVEKWGRGLVPPPLSVACLEHRDASRLWPREPHPAWLLLPGDLTPVPRSLGVTLSQKWTAWAIPPSHGGTPKALENTDILFHFFCLKMQPYPKGKQSSPSLLLKGSCPWQELCPAAHEEEFLRLLHAEWGKSQKPTERSK